MAITINTILARLNALNVNDQAQAAIEQTKGNIEALNRERMLEGRRSDGSIMPDYSPISVSVYGYPPGPIRLKATGAFQGAINVKVGNKTFVTDSDDKKSGMLKARYGDKIFGLDRPGKVEYVAVLRPVFLGKIKSAI